MVGDVCFALKKTSRARNANGAQSEAMTSIMRIAGLTLQGWCSFSLLP
jgi:hypothetical protein